jgi:hypothetical protein
LLFLFLVFWVQYIVRKYFRIAERLNEGTGLFRRDFVISQQLGGSFEEFLFLLLSTHVWVRCILFHLEKVIQFFLNIETKHNDIVSLGFRFIKTKKHFLLFSFICMNHLRGKEER